MQEKKRKNNFKPITSTFPKELFCGQLIISFFNTPNYQKIGMIVDIKLSRNAKKPEKVYAIKWLDKGGWETRKWRSRLDLTLYDTYYLE